MNNSRESPADGVAAAAPLQSLEAFLREVGTLPSLPSLYLQLTEELASPDASPSRVSRIISKDLGLTTKILQIVNSAYFGLSRQISSVERAVLLLGLEMLRTLALSASVFSMFEPSKMAGLAVAGLWRHSMNCSGMARKLGNRLRLKSDTIEHLVTAAFLHDVGKLLLADRKPQKYAEVTRKIREENLTPFEAEKEIFGFDHAQVGALLLNRWQLPEPVAEGVLWHHYPSVQESEQDHTFAGIIHVLDYLEHQHHGEVVELHLELDRDFLGRIGVDNSVLAEWKAFLLEDVGPF
ncbi:MAG: hypothetical protein Kow00109_28730 [Acidobacteriota bacterium]